MEFNKILTEKLLRYGLDEQIVMWVENRLKEFVQRVVSSGTKSSWRPVTIIGVPEGSVLDSVLFSIFVNDLDLLSTLNKFADSTKPGGMADSSEGHATIQRDLEKLEKWAGWNLEQFNSCITVGGDSSPLLSSGKTTPGVLESVLGSPSIG